MDTVARRDLSMIGVPVVASGPLHWPAGPQRLPDRFSPRLTGMILLGTVLAFGTLAFVDLPAGVCGGVGFDAGAIELPVVAAA